MRRRSWAHGSPRAPISRGLPPELPSWEGMGTGQGAGGPRHSPPVGFASSPAFLAGPASGQGALVAATLRGTGVAGGGGAAVPGARCPLPPVLLLSPASGPFAVPCPPLAEAQGAAPGGSFLPRNAPSGNSIARLCVWSKSLAAASEFFMTLSFM